MLAYELLNDMFRQHEFEIAAMNTPPPKVSKHDVDQFCKSCLILRSIYRHYQILFEEGGDLRHELQQSIAPTFFGDINHVLIQHLILTICKITDPEDSCGHKNLTVEFLINNADFSTAPNELDELKQLAKSMHAFRKRIEPARNKLIGHLDRRSVWEGKSLGGAEKSEWNQFWLDLQDFLQILHKRYIDSNGHFYLNTVDNPSDADMLVKALKQSTYFHTLSKDRRFTQQCADVAFNSKYSKA
jgi:AbiU2